MRRVGKPERVWPRVTGHAGAIPRRSLVAPKPVERGARATGARRFSRLLICPHDGSYLTTSPRKGDRVIYTCRIGSHANDHPKPYSVSETGLPEWASFQAGYVATLINSTPPDEEQVNAEIGRLITSRERFAVLYAEQSINEDTWHSKRDEIDRRLEALRASVRSTLLVEGGVRWGGSPEQVNDDLRAICSGIRLGYEGKGRRRRLVPVGGIWKRPPMIDVWDSETGESMLHPDAVPATGGWYLPGSATAKSADERATA